jgi:hypothetical protein
MEKKPSSRDSATSLSPEDQERILNEERRMHEVRVLRARLRRRAATDTLFLIRLAACFVVLTVLVSACGGGGGSDGEAITGSETFRGDGYSFTYPEDWRKLEPSYVAGSTVPPDVVLGPEPGLSIMNVIVGTAAIPIRQDDLPGIEGELAQDVGRLARELGGRITKGATIATVGGLPALEMEISGANNGTALRIQMTFAWDGRTQYQFNCQSTSTQVVQMTRGCHQALQSFTVDK